MLESYTDFMIFEVKDNGEEFRLNTTEEAFRLNNGNKVLHSLQVVVIIKEALRRIYIWKGISSSVRKKFIASRVASELQRRLTESSKFHRCKIISVDQGDEPEEFLNAFGFKKKNLPLNSSTGVDSLKLTLEEKTMQEPYTNRNIKEFNSKTENPPSYQDLKKNQISKNILERVLKEKLPDNYKRTNILIGNNMLYGQIIKKAEIFDDNVEIKEWELISNLSKNIIELDGQKLRIYINTDDNEIEAIEMLEKKSRVKPTTGNEQIDYNKWTVKQLKQFCRENKIRVLSSYRKAEIVNTVKEYTKTL
jgi:hypothetical protein